MTRTRLTIWAAAAVVIAGAVAVVLLFRVSGPAAATPVLATQPDFQPGATPTCLVHQTEQPNGLYQGGSTSSTLPQLTFLAYFTAAGNHPFCDGQPATDTDKAWAQLYVQLTTSRQNVTTILG